ncbi:MAG: hypothetical protein Tsb009_34900 [Planctomycetaceae bacterium]
MLFGDRHFERRATIVRGNRLDIQVIQKRDVAFCCMQEMIFRFVMLGLIGHGLEVPFHWVNTKFERADE